LPQFQFFSLERFSFGKSHSRALSPFHSHKSDFRCKKHSHFGKQLSKEKETLSFVFRKAFSQCCALTLSRKCFRASCTISMGTTTRRRASERERERASYYILQADGNMLYRAAMCTRKINRTLYVSYIPYPDFPALLHIDSI
jgi:hypothetical protein